MKNLNQIIWSLGQYFKLAPPKYEAAVMFSGLMKQTEVVLLLVGKI
jgi:hypothetical protein